MNDETIKRMCWSKKRYPTMIKVFSAMGRVRKRFPKSPSPRSYECPFCQGWHITTHKKREGQPNIGECEFGVVALDKQ